MATSGHSLDLTNPVELDLSVGDQQAAPAAAPGGIIQETPPRAKDNSSKTKRSRTESSNESVWSHSSLSSSSSASSAAYLFTPRQQEQKYEADIRILIEAQATQDVNNYSKSLHLMDLLNRLKDNLGKDVFPRSLQISLPEATTVDASVNQHLQTQFKEAATICMRSFTLALIQAKEQELTKTKADYNCRKAIFGSAMESLRLKHAPMAAGPLPDRNPNTDRYDSVIDAEMHPTPAQASFNLRWSTLNKDAFETYESFVSLKLREYSEKQATTKTLAETKARAKEVAAQGSLNQEAGVRPAELEQHIIRLLKKQSVKAAIATQKEANAAANSRPLFPRKTEKSRPQQEQRGKSILKKRASSPSSPKSSRPSKKQPRQDHAEAGHTRNARERRREKRSVTFASQTKPSKTMKK